jgi:hypothetical protein
MLDIMKFGSLHLFSSMLPLYLHSDFWWSNFRSLSIKQTNPKQALNALFEPFQRNFQEVTKSKFSMNNGSTASAPKVMSYAAGGTKTVQRAML